MQKEMSEKIMEEARKNYGDQLKQFENQLTNIQNDYNHRISISKDSMQKTKEYSQVTNRGAINMSEIRKTNDNFEKLMEGKTIIFKIEFKLELVEKYKEKLNILSEKHKMEKEREMEKEIYKLMKSNEKDISEIKDSYVKEISALKDEINRLQILRKENLTVIIQKEAEIKLLQEKIRADAKQKHSQIRHAKDLCKVYLNLLNLDF